MRRVEVEFRDRRDPKDVWTLKNPILENGEHGYEEDTGKFKIGNGLTRWNDLPYFVPAGTASSDELQAHVDSPTPHPIYDEGPSLILLYENAKV